ncbi:DNA mismatch repair protein MutS [Anaerohalosphaera lusitana]|uniref:DNA mismatch repair protein MutS n=1 Tax=Anaerohalosphaera lusitana TaxID=1936003 RepID=A0A1U9NPQ2_9BACT|nr:DNA mismatch repair protein MutS [Anaerohalosphaera lusitana]AQT69893.1 DNA mismatch repair protein MutS [Anaerohalosphaera lusitana]
MAKKTKKITPAMKQYHHFKEKYADAILFFRMGDFYETFYEDAKTCSRVLGLALTSRDKNTDPIPLAGLPYHAVDGYLKKMLQAGYKVAVCEQVEDPKQAKGVVKRDVVRVVTPGTLTDDMLLEAREDNFLCSVFLGPKSAAVSWVDISTGHFFVQELEDDKAILDEVMRLGPKECLLPEMRGELFEMEGKKLEQQIERLTGATVTRRPGWYFDSHMAKDKLLKHFEMKTLEGFGIDDGFVGVNAAGAVLEYLEETQKTALTHISSLRKVSRSNFLQIDQTSLRSLEILRTIRSESKKGTLLDSVDQTLTGMGSRMMRAWICMPLCDVGAIEMRQDAVAEFAENESACEDIRGQLKEVADLERIVARISTFRTSPKDLLSLGWTLRRVPALREVLAGCEADMAGRLAERCDSMDELADLLEAAIDPDCPPHTRDGGVIRDGFSEELDHLRSVSSDGKTWLAEFQQRQVERTGLANLKVGYNRVFGYYIELPRSMAEKAPADFVRKQTLKNAERYVTDELKKYEDEVLGARDKALELEQRLFEKLREETAKYISRLQELADCIATVDCLAAFGHLARSRSYVRPAMLGDKTLEISEGKHPVLAESLGSEFVPNDVNLGGEDGDLSVITGPNMAGKSTYIRQVALLVLLAQTGSFIPAKEAKIGVVDRIFTRVGASDELMRGQSTFMVEMTETANIINNATDRSLVILDEVGRGTSTYDGLSLAWAITEHIANEIKCRTLFATHYHELTELAELLVNVKNCNVAVREWQDEIVFLHKILPGGTDKSYGIHVAKLAGLPKSVVRRSREILLDLENTFAKEAAGPELTRHKTSDDQQMLFVERNKGVLDRLSDLDVNNLTPIEAINLLNQIKDEIE